MRPCSLCLNSIRCLWLFISTYLCFTPLALAGNSDWQRPRLISSLYCRLPGIDIQQENPLSFVDKSYRYCINCISFYVYHRLTYLCLDELEQLERLRYEDTPHRLMITHTIESCWVPNQNKVEWPWRYRSRSKVITCDTPSHASSHLCQIWKESIRNCRCYRADTIFKAKAKWPWRYRSRSKVIICNTPAYTSDHLCWIWKESIENCRIIFKVKGEKFQKFAKNSNFQILKKT